jgi:hypothetical protein
LRAAIVRFLSKVAFFSVMVALGDLGLQWIPCPPIPTLNWVEIVTGAAALCCAIMFFFGLMGLGVTVFTLGRKPD